MRYFAVLLLVLTSGLMLSASEPNDCSFLKNPKQYQIDTQRIHRMQSDLTAQVASFASSAQPAVYGSAGTVDPKTIPHRNFIDDYIFSRMAAAGIQSAPIATDTEFLRRVTLDLTGRIPSASDVDPFAQITPQVTTFAASVAAVFGSSATPANPANAAFEAKRDQKIDALIGSPEFIDKWTMFLGDLLRVNAQSTQVNRYTPGRDAFYAYVKDAVTTNKAYDQIAREVIAANGDSFVQGEANWPVGTTIAMGPAQDTYDGAAANLSSMFLGINTVDCLLCHDGPRHLDTVSLWGYGETRYNMWGLSAYFARLRMPQTVVTATPRVVKYVVGDVATGEYQLNTTTGNRQARQPSKGVSVVAPSNPFAPNQPNGGVMQGEGRRDAIARQITGNIQFSRAIVNYVWEKLMVQAFVSPSNTFDLARLDSAEPPPSPWTLQPTNPDLLEALAQWFQQNHYDLRALIGLIVKSNAYQLSAVYPGNWDVSYVPYYARKYVRRLDAEEVHDAVTKATGIIPTYTLNNSTLPPVQWAMQFPDTKEPLSNGTVVQFLNSFGRGDRDTSPRRSDGSILQSLNLMNSNVVMSRIHQTNTGSQVQILLSQNASPQTIIDQLYLNTLSRHPSSDEVAYLTPLFQQQGTRVAAENLQWVLINKMDFLFNY